MLSLVAATRTWKLVLLARYADAEAVPAPSVTLFQVVPPSVLTCTVPVSLPIVALPLARLRADRGRAGGVAAREVHRVHQVRAFGARRRADRGHRQGRGGVADRAQPLTGVCAPMPAFSVWSLPSTMLSLVAATHPRNRGCWPVR